MEVFTSDLFASLPHRLIDIIHLQHQTMDITQHQPTDITPRLHQHDPLILAVQMHILPAHTAQAQVVAMIFIVIQVDLALEMHFTVLQPALSVLLIDVPLIHLLREPILILLLGKNMMFTVMLLEMLPQNATTSVVKNY